ncbi:hypothetical protein H5410_013279 [Solanum commersonii]|uniref:Uncharacterized protein n=1 Tax=Solanum commersonii TaxID=4109 RepID=A0A9J6AU12_SOLCO|nr:hypothetical protein H5410_013279 [Solanum commersonii]
MVDIDSIDVAVLGQILVVIGIGLMTNFHAMEKCQIWSCRIKLRVQIKKVSSLDDKVLKLELKVHRLISLLAAWAIIVGFVAAKMM